MITTQELDKILDEYTEQFVPAMLKWKYHLILVKGGPQYPHLSEQSHFAHIVNGVFGLAQLIRYFVEYNVSLPNDLDDAFVRKVFALYTIHEVHKDDGYEKIGSTEFSIPLWRLRDEYEKLGLTQFANLDDFMLRAGNVHKRSTKHGDILLTNDASASRLYLFVRIADTFASVKSPDEAINSLKTYFKQLGPAFAPKSPPGKYSLYFHQLKDVRGVLTNTIHNAVVQELQQKQLFPLLYFATGTLYIGPSSLTDFNKSDFIRQITTRVLGALTHYGQEGSGDAIRTGLRERYFDFEEYVYSFADVESILDVVKEDSLSAKPDLKKIGADVDTLAAKWSEEDPWTYLGISDTESKVFNEHWVRVRRYLLYVDKIIRLLCPRIDGCEWFSNSFKLPQAYRDNLKNVGGLWATGGPGKYVLPIAYHFLKGPHFSERSAESSTAEQVLDRLHQYISNVITELDTRAGRETVVKKIGLRPELEQYLGEYLELSFSQKTILNEDNLAAYAKSKGKGHNSNICSLCNRASEYAESLRTGILDDSGQNFSNRVLPAQKAPGKLRLWCPVCQLEFILRKLTGLGLPTGAEYNKSKRIYLYVLPTYSFTSEHLRIYRRLLQPFHQVTNIPIRNYGADEGLPSVWLKHQDFGAEWNEELLEILNKQSQRIGESGGRSYVGERISFGGSEVDYQIGQPHYYLITWEKTAGDKADDERIATRTEAWAKALFAAGIISGLTSCKVYVTERPYLPVADPAEIKPTITLDGPPPLIRSLTGERQGNISLYGHEEDRPSELERLLNVSAALWTVTSEVHAPDRRPKDKYIAERLGILNSSALAGASFYKEFGRLQDGKSPDEILATACEVLLSTQIDNLKGQKLMDLVEKIAKKSLEIALPLGTFGRGKARRYELVFREAISAIRKAQKLIPEMRQAALTGQIPTQESIDELKQLSAGTLLKAFERRIGNRRGEVMVTAFGEELSRRIGEFIDIIVDELYLERASANFAQFIRLENSLADGIYYYTDRHLQAHWDEYKKNKAARNQAKESQMEVNDQ